MRRRSSPLRAAAIALSCVAFVRGEETRPARHVDAPLLRISCDELPVKTPTPTEAKDDERERPYHALVRVWSFPGRAPLDVPIERLTVRGAGGARKVGPGEFLFSDIAVGYTAVVLTAEPGETREPRAAGPGKRAVAGRNPLVLARHAITVCDLFVPEDPALDRTTRLGGIVVDRADGAPIADAAVACGETVVRTGADGRFLFADPVRWRDLLDRTVVGSAGFRPFEVNARALSAPWVDRLLQDGDAVFTLAREGDEKAVMTTKLPRLER